MKKQATKDQAIEQIRAFITKHGREPQSKDFLTDPSLPHARQIQRHFGGLTGIRKDMGLSTISYTTGKHRSKIAQRAMLTSQQKETEMFNTLFEKYDTRLNLPYDENVTVRRQVQYQEYIPGIECYSNTSVDMAITFRPKKHVIMIDIFHPKDLASLTGCVNIKRIKTEKNPVTLVNDYTHDLYFVCTNPDISQEEIDRIIKPHAMYKTLSYSTFCRDILDV